MISVDRPPGMASLSPTNSSLFRRESHHQVRIARQELDRLVAGVAAKSVAGSKSVLLALIICLLDRYLTRDHIRIAVLSTHAGSDAPIPARVAIALPLTPSMRFRELAAIASSLPQDGGRGRFDAMASPLPTAQDESVPDAVVIWQESSSTQLSLDVQLDRTEFLFEVVQDADSLLLAVRLAGPASHRVSPPVLGEIVAHMIQGLSKDPDVTIARLPLMSAALRHRVLVEFNGRAVPYPQHRTILHLFEDCAARLPDHPALAFRGWGASHTEA